MSFLEIISKEDSLVKIMVLALIFGLGAIYRSSAKHHNDCLKKHAETTEKLIKVTGDLGEVKGKIHIAEQVHNKLNLLIMQKNNDSES